MHQEIVEVARDLFERSGRVEGRDLDNWFEAERIVTERIMDQESPKKTRTACVASGPKKREAGQEK